ncbi:MAG: hypothetical protein QXV75_07120 [Candidatus Bathyarchaeia archaeon]
MQQLHVKVKEVFKEKLNELLEEIEIDFTRMSFDELVTVIHGADISTLEELSEDIIYNENLSEHEKLQLLQMIDERYRKEVGF